jgi:DNA-binding transcriptional MocR family regulator
VEGAAAGLHLTVKLPERSDDRPIVSALRRRGMAIESAVKLLAEAIGLHS